MPLKVVILSLEFPPGPGGLGMYAYQSALHLSRLGCQVIAATPQAYFTRAEIEAFNRSQAFTICRFPDRHAFIWESIERFAVTLRLIQRFHPDLILAFGKQAIWLGCMISKLCSLPLVATGIGSEFAARGFFQRNLTLMGFRQAKWVIFISRFTQAYAAAQGYSIKQASVIPLGADAHLFYPGFPAEDLRQKLRLVGQRVILTVGQVYERKAQDIVIRALPEVVKQFADVTYLIVGLPTQKPQLEALAYELGVASHVVFTGNIAHEDLPAYYNLADCFILVSRQSAQGDVEGFGIVAVEAALCGLPAIVAENTGLVEAIIPGETGLVVPQESPAETARALLKLLSDEDLRSKMGAAARQAALTNFTWEKRIGQVHHLLQQIVAKG